MSDEFIRSMAGSTEPKPKRKGGFASLSPERRAEISRLGGKAAHAKGVAHRFSPEEARAAGKLGGKACWEAARAKEARHDETIEDFNRHNT